MHVSAIGKGKFFIGKNKLHQYGSIYKRRLVTNISVCYILSYYSPQYIRTTTLVQALQNIHNVNLFQARNTSRGFVRYFQTLAKLIAIRIKFNPQYYILGFRGYELFWPVRMITFGKTLIFDHMMSPYDSLINEKKTIKADSVIGRFIYYYEKIVLQFSDKIITDTALHKYFFQETFGIDHEKIMSIPVGADELLGEIKNNINPYNNQRFNILFYGSFLPLHGVNIILQSALELRNLPIQFTLIGGNRIDLTEFNQFIKQHDLKNITHIKWVDFQDLSSYIQFADVGLGGPFGNTGQAKRVITGKTYQFLAMKKPVIIGAVEMETGFVDQDNCLLIPQSSPEKLSQSILWAFEHKHELDRIGQRGNELYISRYSVSAIAGDVEVLFFGNPQK
jgi:glycosyltransferase involved in cell wall biosynthesis